MSNHSFSQSRIARYCKCPTLYEFEKIRDVDVIDESTRYLDRGNALHLTIERVCNEVRNESRMSDEMIQSRAIEHFEDAWEEETDSAEYPAKAVYQDDREKARSAIQTFFTEGAGINHARNSLATEHSFEFVRDGMTYTGKIDNVVDTENGITLIDYKTGGIKKPFARHNYVEKHLNGDYRPDRIKHAIQAHLYLIGFSESDFGKKVLSEEADLEFNFYMLMKNVETERTPHEVSHEVSAQEYSIADKCKQNSSKIWYLIEEAVTGIEAEKFRPDSDRWEDIKNETCKQCKYRTICPQYLNEAGVKR